MAAVDVEEDRICRQRLKQVFDYLKALNDHRNPAVRHINDQPWRMWLDDLPRDPAVELPIKLIDSGEGDDDSSEPDDRYLLRVRRPELTQPPPPPTELRDWIQSGWDAPDKQAEHIKIRNEVNGDGLMVTVRFDDDDGRVTAFDAWAEQHDQWGQAEKPRRSAMGVFEKLYSLYGRLQRDAELYDLVVGDGLLSWQHDDGGIYHPLLMQRVQLVFDAQLPEFRVIEADRRSELYTHPIQSVEGVDPRMLARQQNEYADADYHPLCEEATAFLEGLVNALSSQGRFIGNSRPAKASPYPEIGRAPVLFLRSRSKGYGNAIDAVIETLASRDDFSDGLRKIVGCVTSHDEGNPQAAEETREWLAKDVLFGKDANPEQLRIARQVACRDVLVQGPPGTGKSHTIANLIGHLLANGKSVLVTSHTTKALRVLRDHVAEELRPLCVSVLESDLDSKQQLEASVQAITGRLSENNAAELERDAQRLERQRDELLGKLQASLEDLRQARANEYRKIVVAGKEWDPSDAARHVARGRAEHDWIPSPVTLGEPLPLPAVQVLELYSTNASTCLYDEDNVEERLPSPSEIPSPDQFGETVKRSLELAASGSYERRLWLNAEVSSKRIERIRQVSGAISDIGAEFTSFRQWQLSAVEAGRLARARGGPWEHLLGKIEEIRRFLDEASLDLARHSPAMRCDLALTVQRIIATEIHGHLSRGGSLGFVALLRRRRWRQALCMWTVQRRTPSTADEMAAVLKLLEIEIARNELRLLWDGLMTPEGAPSSAELGSEPEQNASQFARPIRDALEWWSAKFAPLAANLFDVGFDWERFVGGLPPNLSRFGPMTRLVEGTEKLLAPQLLHAADYLQSLFLKNQLRELSAGLARFQRIEAADLRAAVDRCDSEAYRPAFDRCLVAADRRERASRRRELLAMLERKSASRVPLAGAWAKAIRDRHGPHGNAAPPGDVERAWEWRQLNDELVRRAETDLDDLGRKIERIKAQIKQTTNQLIDRRAWAAQVRRTSDQQRQALMGWAALIGRIGKGFGKRVSTLRRAAQEQMDACRDAVPVWIMPLTRVAESFDFNATRFDVVIIDEASQCDIMGLLALALGRRVIVVGDDKQVSPLAVGQNQGIVDNLIAQFLDGIPNAALYDGRMSVYDLAKTSFAGSLCLTEHFRCVPDIIEFSNQLSYGGKLIKPLREASTSPLLPHVVPYRVDGSCDARKVNREEAWAVASLVAAAVEHPAYAGQTFGVISLLGGEGGQAIEIERLLLAHLPPEEYRRRRIMCGSSAQFQGDERDVVFLSMVHSPGDGPLRLSDRAETQQRFNVAASRARNQMWVVYSLNHETDLKPGDLRRRLIEHALDPQSLSRAVARTSERTESPFEREVLRRLMAEGYRVRPQWAVGRYRIDLVVEGSGNRLAVECDGDRFHPIDKLPEDMERQAILERLGWRFVRLRGSEFFRDPEAAMQPVFQRLHELEIAPEGHGTQPAPSPSRNDIIEELRRQAAQIRYKWRSREESRRTASRDDNEGDAEMQRDLFEPDGNDDARELEDVSDQAMAAEVVLLSKDGPAAQTAEGRGTTTGDGAQRCGAPAKEPELEIWRMTRVEFHRYKKAALPPDQIDNYAISREYAAAIRKAVAEGKDVAPAMLREIGMPVG